MEIDGIPALAADTDLHKIKPINNKKLLAYINYYITYTVDFMNRFSSVNEERLKEVTTRLQKLEVAMAVLEAKLSSIPGLDDVTLDSQNQQPVQQQQSEVTQDVPQDQIQQSEEIAPTERESEFVPVKNDARYKKYFDMLRVRVPAQAVKMKMSAEGVDPAILDLSPDAPAPDGGIPIPVQDEEDDFDSVDGNNSSDSFSD